MYFKYRKAGGKCGFAESMPQDRITALKKDETPVEMTDVTETANGIIQKGEAAPQTYPEPTYKLGYKAYEKWDTVSWHSFKWPAGGDCQKQMPLFTGFVTSINAFVMS